MKTFTASHLSHKPAEVFEEARANGAIIQQKRTNGDVIEEFVMLSKSKLEEMECDYNTDRFTGLSDMLLAKDYKKDDFYNRIGQVAVGLKNAKGDALDPFA